MRAVNPVRVSVPGSARGPQSRTFLISVLVARALSPQLPATLRRIHGAVENSLGKLPRLTGWQPVLPGIIAPTLQFPDSARVSRVGFGVSPKQSCREVRKGETPLPVRETRALPGIIAQHV